MSDSIRQLQVRGLADDRLDPEVAAAVLGSMTNRFPEMWLCEGRVECGFDEGVEQLVTLFLNALRIPTPGAGERVGAAGSPTVGAPGGRSEDRRHHRG